MSRHDSFAVSGAPLAALPAELIDHRQGQIALATSEYSEGRPFLFNLLNQDCLLVGKDIWKYIVPYRHLRLLCASRNNSCRAAYDFFISSLDSWFKVNRLSPLNFNLWSIAMLLTIMRDLSTDLEARRIYFNLISDDMADLFRAASPAQLSFLADRLLNTSSSKTNPQSPMQCRIILSRSHCK